MISLTFPQSVNSKNAFHSKHPIGFLYFYPFKLTLALKTSWSATKMHYHELIFDLTSFYEGCGV